MEPPGNAAVVAALRQLRRQLRWRPGKAQQHVGKRVALGHLPPQATVATYEALIQTILQTPTAAVWVYRWGEVTYPTVVTLVDGGDKDTLLGANNLVIDGTARTIRLGNGPAVPLPSVDALGDVDTLDDLQRVASGVGVFTVHTAPAKKVLPDGRNAHLIQQPPEWWLPKFMERFDLATFNRMPMGFWVGVERKSR